MTSRIFLVFFLFSALCAPYILLTWLLLHVVCDCLCTINFNNNFMAQFIVSWYILHHCECWGESMVNHRSQFATHFDTYVCYFLIWYRTANRERDRERTSEKKLINSKCRWLANWICWNGVAFVDEVDWKSPRGDFSVRNISTWNMLPCNKTCWGVDRSSWRSKSLMRARTNSNSKRFLLFHRHLWNLSAELFLHFFCCLSCFIHSFPSTTCLHLFSVAVRRRRARREVQVEYEKYLNDRQPLKMKIF